MCSKLSAKEIKDWRDAIRDIGGKTCENELKLTKFGRFVRELRIERNELMKDMAEKFGVSVSKLSSVEVGKTEIPNEWPEKLIYAYNLNEEEIQKLKDSLNNVIYDSVQEFFTITDGELFIHSNFMHTFTEYIKDAIKFSTQKDAQYYIKKFKNNVTDDIDFKIIKVTCNLVDL